MKIQNKFKLLIFLIVKNTLSKWSYVNNIITWASTLKDILLSQKQLYLY